MQSSHGQGRPLAVPGVSQLSRAEGNIAPQLGLWRVADVHPLSIH